jgi:hypothetical protein
LCCELGCIGIAVFPAKNNSAIAPNPTDAFQKNSVENHVRAASLHASITILIDIHRPLKTAPSGDASVARRASGPDKAKTSFYVGLPQS